MTMRLRMIRIGVAAVVLAAAGSASAQTPAGAKPTAAAKPPATAKGPAGAKAAEVATPPQAPNAEAPPLRCWWKTSKSSIVIGERFVLTLTCGIVETARGKTVLDVNQLQPTAIQLSPFEVVSGERHEDVL